MNKQQKIDAIYEKIARKDLTTGCICFDKSPDIQAELIFLAEQKEKFFLRGVERVFYFRYKRDVLNDGKRIFYVDPLFFEIIGHPVMIGDVMDYFKIKVFPINSHATLYGANSEAEILELWKNLRNPIEDQSDECVDFVYNLISE